MYIRLPFVRYVSERDSGCHGLQVGAWSGASRVGPALTPDA